MLVLVMRRAIVSQDTLETLPDDLGKLPDHYRPVLTPAIALQTEILGLAPDARADSSSRTLEPEWAYGIGEEMSTIRAAELFTDGKCLMLVIGREQSTRLRPVRPEADSSEQEVRHAIYLFFISPELDLESFSTFESALTNLTNASFTNYYYTSSRFRELEEEGRLHPEPPSSSEVLAASALMDKATRTLALAIKTAGGLLVKDIHRQLSESDREGASSIQETLLNSGLVTTENVVSCRKTSAQVARLDAPADVANLSSTGIRCACGRPLQDERVEEALTLSDLGREVLDGSKWMTKLLLHELAAVGIPPERVFVEQQSGGDEMDCLADVSGEMVLFELKDKEFNLGNAYSFGAKMGVMRPDHAVVVTTEHVGNDAKDHFQRAGLGSTTRRARNRRAAFLTEETPNIQYFEGISRLQADLRTFVSSIYAADAARVLREALLFSALEPQVLLSEIASRSRDELS